MSLMSSPFLKQCSCTGGLMWAHVVYCRHESFSLIVMFALESSEPQTANLSSARGLVHNKSRDKIWKAILDNGPNFCASTYCASGVESPPAIQCQCKAVSAARASN